MYSASTNLPSQDSDLEPGRVSQLSTSYPAPILLRDGRGQVQEENDNEERYLHVTSKTRREPGRLTSL